MDMVTGLLVLAAAAVTVPPRPDQARMLVSHNRARAEAGVEPLVWDWSLAADALQWARHLADADAFEHSSQDGEGENLWMGTRGAYSPEEMVGSWVDEQKLYRAGVFPDVAKTGRWSDVGHYTQVIWHGTRKVGCAVAGNAENDVLVCRYSPPGNVMGEMPAPGVMRHVRN
jgi:hypothetical protein